MALLAGPAAADTELGELLLDALPIAAACGYALDLHRTRFLCGATFRLGVRRADGSLDTRGFKGGAADMITNALRLQAPWLAAARARPRDEARWSRTQLVAAADAGDERRVRELLAAGAAVDGASGLAQTALHAAAWRGHARVVAALLEGAGVNGAGARAGVLWGAGASVNARDVYGATPLMRASYVGHLAVVRMLLARGADQALQGRLGGRTALHRAAFTGRSRVVALLCAAPGAAAALALRDAAGRTPLDVAVAFRRAACAEAIRRAGAGAGAPAPGAGVAVAAAAVTAAAAAEPELETEAAETTSSSAEAAGALPVAAAAPAPAAAAAAEEEAVPPPAGE